ncbi:MAG: GTPase HflX [Balneolales bacterium]
MNTTSKQQERVILIGLYGQDIDRIQAEEYIDELELLADTAGGLAVQKILQNRLRPDPATFLGKGKLQELSEIVKAGDIDAVIFDDDLSATQARNIEKAVETKVLDRSGLILDIFASRAQTAASKTQVELAQLQYLLPRLTRYWTHLSRQKGGIGTKGPGETQIETDRRLIAQRISTLKEKLIKLESQRGVQRKSRSDTLRTALVGYTNAGKSSLMNALVDSNVFAENRLFATLDSKVRRFTVNKDDVLLSDTVGFIRKLPHNLIESFKSTLDEIREADILLHVVDVSSHVFRDYIHTVDKTLLEIKADSKPVILIFNKVDRVNDSNYLAALKTEFPDAVFVSAIRSIGLDSINDRLKSILEENYIYKELHVPVKHQNIVSYLHDVADIQKKEYDEHQVHLGFKINKKHLGQLKNLLKRSEITETIV